VRGPWTISFQQSIQNSVLEEYQKVAVASYDVAERTYSTMFSITNSTTKSQHLRHWDSEKSKSEGGGEWKPSGEKKEKKAVRIELRKSGKIRVNPKSSNRKERGRRGKGPFPTTHPLDAPLDSCIFVPSDKFIASLTYFGTSRYQPSSKMSNIFWYISLASM